MVQFKQTGSVKRKNNGISGNTILTIAFVVLQCI